MSSGFLVKQGRFKTALREKSCKNAQNSAIHIEHFISSLYIAPSSQFLKTNDPKYASYSNKTHPTFNGNYSPIGQSRQWSFSHEVKVEVFGLGLIMIMQVCVSAVICRLFRVLWLTKRALTILELNWYEGLGHHVGTETRTTSIDSNSTFMQITFVS